MCGIHGSREFLLFLLFFDLLLNHQFLLLPPVVALLPHVVVLVVVVTGVLFLQLLAAEVEVVYVAARAFAGLPGIG